MPTLDELYPVPKLIACAEALERAGIPYAFGGAFMMVYWGEPRATTDIDINIFLPPDRADDALSALQSLGIRADWDGVRREIGRASQVRLDYDGTPVDLFFPFDPFHEVVESRTIEKRFGDTMVRVLTAEDIVVFKTLFNRPRDWPDIESIIAVQGDAFDGDYALEWLERILGAEDSALRRLRGLIEEYRENPA